MEADWVPSQQRADTPITRQAEGILRRLGTGAVIKYLLLSQRERQRLLDLDKQEETGIWQTPHLPPPLLGGISLEGKNVLITPCMPGALPGLRYALPTPSLYSRRLTSPLIQGASEATRQSLDFCSRQQP